MVLVLVVWYVRTMFGGGLGGGDGESNVRDATA